MLPVGYKFKIVSELKLQQVLEAGRIGREVNTVLAADRRRKYNESPNICLECKSPIIVPENADSGKFSEIKKKKFCNRSCGAKYHNRVLGYPHRKPKLRTCVVCGISYTSPGRQTTKCSECRKLKLSILSNRKKSECLVQEIRTHARAILFRLKSRKCEVCGYGVRVDCCHIRPIKEFSEDTKLYVINDIENLKALCPNHHVELDLGILDLSAVSAA